MKKNNLIKIIMLVSILLCMFSDNIVYGAGTKGYEREEQLNQKQSQQVHEDRGIFQDPTENPGFWEPTIEDDSTLAVKAGTVLGFINVIGVISAVIVLVVLGIKYMLGSLEEKAEYKKAMIPYLIGVFLIVAATSIPNIISKIINTEGFFG